MRTLALAVLLALFVVAPVAAYHDGPEHKTKPSLGEKVGVEQRLNQQVPLDLQFRDEAGRTVRLGDYFGEKQPIILTLNYYKCPRLCPAILEGLMGSLKEVPLAPGRDYKVVTVGIDPRETATDAITARNEVLKHHPLPGVQNGWNVLTGDQASIERLAQAVGVQYAYDRENDQYAHPSVISVLTPTGKVSRYFFGVQFSPRDVEFGLMDSSSGRIGSVAKQILLKCFKYDPVTGKYTGTVLGTLRIAGILTLVAMGTYIVRMVRREQRPSRGVAREVG